MILKTAASLLFLIVLFASQTLANEGQPNVVIILTDDQGWADIGYNNENVYSPNLDQLAANSLVFEQHYVMPQCTPTRVALMTGRYPSRFGGPALAASNKPAFPHGTPTLAAMFKKAGYETYLCGKWHLGSTPEHGPNHFGFDHSYGSFTGAVGMYDHRYRKGNFYEAWHRDHEKIEGHENGTHATELIGQECIEIIKAKRDKPFFLYIPFHSVHTPLDERGPFVDQPTTPDPNNPERWINEDKIQWFHDPKGKIQSEKDPEKRLFLASVNHLDDVVGRIVAALKDSGKLNDTLILFSSDNGPQVNWPGNAYPDDLKLTNFNQPHPFRGKKVDVWEGGIHVPGFAFWPGKIHPSKTKIPVHIIDWFPTLAQLLNQQSPTNLDGQDLSPLLFGKNTIPERDLYFTWSSRINRWALRSGDWKAVKYGVGTPAKPTDWQLFNLKEDPDESEDLAATHSEQLGLLHQKFLVQRSKDKQSAAKNKAK